MVSQYLAHAFRKDRHLENESLGLTLRLSSLAITAASLLGGCTVNNTTLNLPRPQPTNGAHFSGEYAAVANTKGEINHWVDLHPDCSIAGIFTVRIIAPPTHGTAIVQPGQFYPRYPQGSQKYVCNLRPRDGVDLTYQPAAGYLGPDMLTISVTTPEGNYWTTDWHITVR